MPPLPRPPPPPASKKRPSAFTSRPEEDEFMRDLFSGLDESAFASSPPPSSLPRAPSSSASTSKAIVGSHKLHPTRAEGAISTSGKPTTGTSNKQRQHHALVDASASTSDLPPSPARQARPVPVPPRPFWDQPVALPPPTKKCRTTQGQSTEIKIQEKDSNSYSKGRNSQLGLASLRKVRYLDIEIEGKENDEAEKGEMGAEKVDWKGKAKGKERQEVIGVKDVKEEEKEVNFDELLGGMDWSWDAVLSQEEVKVEPKWDSLSQRLRKEDREVVVPLSKRYIRCEVRSVTEVLGTTNRMEKKLEVLVKNVKGTRTVLLRDDWVETPVEAGDTINLIGDFAPTSTPSIIISRADNVLILHPDILVSSTKVADSSNCARKALLQELIRSSAATSTPALVYGNMLHELMQTCLTEDKWNDEFRGSTLEGILERERFGLWGMQLGKEKAREEMMEKSARFAEFKETFGGKEPGPYAFLADPRANGPDKSRARLGISDTLEVEEDIWSPKYGLKGKVDVSITGKVTSSNSEASGSESTFPFEIKTGKAFAGMEHRAQTMLYTLLMSDRYDEVIESGLLYYSQSNEVFLVQAARNEIRGLLIARNEFATFLHRRMTLSEKGGDLKKKDESEDAVNDAEVPETLEESMTLREEESMTLREEKPKVEVEKVEMEEITKRPLLPPPIDDERSCKWCYVGDACMLFRRAIEGELEISEDDGEPLQILYEERTGHLSDRHAEFFKHWERLISLEEQELVRFKKEIWTMDAEERMKVGRCIANVVIDETFEAPPNKAGSKIHRYTYRLQLASPPPSQATSSQRAARSLLGGNICLNDPVVVSLETPSVLSIARGFVLQVTPYDIVLGLDHSLVDNPQAARAKPRLETSKLIFRIDKDELAAGMGRIRDNLIQLFVVGGDEKRRRLIVDLEPPKFHTVRTGAIQDLDPSNLNPDQIRAVSKVLSAKDYALILGMPGTGKTTTIAEILKALVKEGKSVLLTSYTHSAVDNILLKVKDSGINILRLGNRDKIMPVLHQFTMDPEAKATSPAELDNQLMSPQVVATTCLSINEPLFSRRRFDVCIVDEASQVTLPTCIGPLRFADMFVLVGDHHQLPPLVRNLAARKEGLDVSLFKRLSEAHPDSVVFLTHQYRMNEDIMLLSNKLVYSDRLQVGSRAIATQRLELSQPEGLACIHEGAGSHEGPCWIQDLLDPNRKVVFVDTDGLPAPERKFGPLIENKIEASLVYQTTDALLKCGIPQADIGVIALYRQQIKLLSGLLDNYPDVEVLTADRSQGRDKECIIMSLTRSNSEGQVGDLLKDWRRINVCLTRAKSKLIIFGSRTTLAHLPLLQTFFDVVQERGWIYKLDQKAHELHAAIQPQSPAVRLRPKTPHVGPGKKALSQPLALDIVNSL